MTAQDRRPVLLVNEDPYVLRACSSLGRPVVLVHGPGLPDSGYVQVAPEVRRVFVDDVTSIEAVLSALTRAGAVDEEYACVYTTDEEALVTAAALARILGVRGMDPDVAVHFRDKWLQKQVVARAGVEVAESRVVEDAHDIDPSVFDGFDAAVLKPIAGGGTQRTSVVRSRHDLSAVGEDMRRSGTKQRTFVLEEFVEGDEWVANGVVSDGVLQFFSVETYAEPCLTTVTTGHALQVEIFDPEADAWAYALAGPVVAASLEALGLRDAVFHMELFHRGPDRAPVFGECAARRGGGLTQETVQHKFAVDLGALAIRCAIGPVAHVERTVRPGVVGATSLANRPGTVLSYPALEEVDALPGVEYVQLELPYGAQMRDALAGTFERVGQVMVTGATRVEFRERCDVVTRWFQERLVVVPQHASTRQLRAWQYAHWPATSSEFDVYVPQR